MRTVLALGLLVVSSAAQAADPDFSSDRPGFSNSTRSVPFGRFAVEGGVSTELDFEDDTDPTVFLPEALMRVGLPFGLEARVQAPSLGVRPAPPGGVAVDEVGVSELGLGVKLSLDPLGVPISGIGTLTVPLETNEFGQSDEVTADFNVNAAFDVVPGVGLSLAGFLGYANDSWQGSLGAGVGFAVGTFSPYAQVFVERSADRQSFPGPEGLLSAKSETVTLGVGAGFAWMVLDRLQVDLSADLLPVRDSSLTEDIGEDLALDDPVGLRAGVGATVLL